MAALQIQAQFVSLPLPNKPSTFFRPHHSSSSSSSHLVDFTALNRQLRCVPRFTCLFSNNRNNKEQARKALEGALGSNKDKFDKWDQEIKKREQTRGGGGGAGGGNRGAGGGGSGWFGWGDRFGDSFWQEAQQFSLAILGILVLYLVAAKGDLLLSVIINPLLFALRSTRSSVAYMTSHITRLLYPAGNLKVEDNVQIEPERVSAKERVVSKWGTD